MGDAGASDDPLGSKGQTREMEGKNQCNSTPETPIYGLTILETKRKIGDTFNNLEVKSVTLSTTQTATLVVPYPTVCPVTRLPAFYALAQRSGNVAVRLELTTFHGKVLMSEYLTTELDILESVILAQFDDDKLRLCMGRKELRRESLGRLLIEHLGADIVYRSRNCLYIAHEDHGERCAACSGLVDIKNELEDKHGEDSFFSKHHTRGVARSESSSARKLVPSKVLSDERPPLTIPETERCQTKRSTYFEEEGFDIDFDSDFVARDDFENFDDVDEHGGDPDFQPSVNHSDVIIAKQRRKQMKFKNSTNVEKDQGSRMKMTGIGLKCRNCKTGFRAKAMLEEHTAVCVQGQDPEEVVVKKEEKEGTKTPAPVDAEVETAQDLRAVGKESRSANKVTRISCRDLKRNIDELTVGDDEGSKIMRRKLKEQLGSKEPICPRCNKPYKSKASFVKHLRQCILGVQSEPDLSFECKVCLAILSSQQTFDNHMQLHHSRIDLNVSVECPECGEKLESKILLTQHYRFTHNPTKGVCPICLLVTDGSTLARHLKKKHFLKHHLCTVCGKEFDMLLKMQVHMSTAHAEITGSPRIVCEQCGKTFAHKERLRQHRTMVHVNNMAKQQCQFCGKVCHTLHALYKHKKIHSKTKPWQCSLCDYRAVVRGNVSLHMRKVHKKEGIAYHDIIRIGDYTY